MFKSINGGLLPQRATKYSAGFDVFANEDVVIGAGDTKLIGLGISLDDIDVFVYNCNYHGKLSEQNSFCDDLSGIEQLEFFKETHYFMLCLRSSLAVKGLILPNGHGVIDIDYKNEIKMIITNPLQSKQIVSNGCNYEVLEYSEDYEYKINRGDKIGQLILCRHEGWLMPAEYTKDEERTGGFGSTNKGE